MGLRRLVFLVVCGVMGCDAAPETTCPEGEHWLYERCVTERFDGGVGDASTPDAFTPDAFSPDAFSADDGGLDAFMAPDVPPDAGPMYEDPSGRSGTRLRRRYLESEPGGYMTIDFWDTELDVACTFREDARGDYRCLPSKTQGIYFTDSGCSDPVQTVSGCAHAWYRDSQGTYYRPTDTPAVVDTIYYRSGERCIESFVDRETPYYAAERAPLNTFVSATVELEERSDLLVTRYLQATDGAWMLLDTVHRTRNYRCEFSEEGLCEKQYGGTSTRRYADARCRTPLHGLTETTEEDPPYLRHQAGPSVCDPRYRYYEVGGRVSEGTRVYFIDASLGCMPGEMEPRTRYLWQGREMEGLPQAVLQVEGDAGLAPARWVDAEGRPMSLAHRFVDRTSGVACVPRERVHDEQAVCVPTPRGYVNDREHRDDTCSGTQPLASISCDSAPPALAQVQSGSCDSPLWGLVASYEPGERIGRRYYVQPYGSSRCEERVHPTTSYVFALGRETTDELPELRFEIE